MFANCMFYAWETVNEPQQNVTDQHVSVFKYIFTAVVHSVPLDNLILSIDLSGNPYPNLQYFRTLHFQKNISLDNEPAKSVRLIGI